MGVIYEAADDVADLLIPFVRAKGGMEEEAAIRTVYRRASLGLLSGSEFWEGVGLDASLEDEYLGCHRLSAGLSELLEAAPERFGALGCLSNDVAEWSQKLRARFGLERYISAWIISGEVGARKPARAIYEILLSRLDVPAERVLFVDDRDANLDTAASLGFSTALFDPRAERKTDSHPIIHRLPQALDL
jgi:putative hydrolase of the HAD superfamily